MRTFLDIWFIRHHAYSTKASSLNYENHCVHIFEAAPGIESITMVMAIVTLQFSPNEYLLLKKEKIKVHHPEIRLFAL